jgi:hypothetical protein
MVDISLTAQEGKLMSTIVKLSYKASGGHICDISWYIEEIFTVFTGFYDKSALRCSRRM